MLMWYIHRYIWKVDCSRFIIYKNILQRASASSRHKTMQTGLTALLVCLRCIDPACSACSLKWIFVVTTRSTNKRKQGRWFTPLISLFFKLCQLHHHTVCARYVNVTGFSSMKVPILYLLWKVWVCDQYYKRFMIVNYDHKVCFSFAVCLMIVIYNPLIIIYDLSYG